MDYLILIVALMGAVLVVSGVRSILTGKISGDDINGKYTPESIRGFSKIYGSLEALSGLLLLGKSALDCVDRYLKPIPVWVGWLLFGLAVAVLVPLWFLEKKYLIPLPEPEKTEDEEIEAAEEAPLSEEPPEPEVTAVVDADGVRIVQEKAED